MVLPSFGIVMYSQSWACVNIAPHFWPSEFVPTRHIFTVPAQSHPTYLCATVPYFNCTSAVSSHIFVCHGAIFFALSVNKGELLMNAVNLHRCAAVCMTVVREGGGGEICEKF